MSTQLVHQYLLNTARQFPEKPAIICDDRSLSYKKFLKKIDTLSMLLVEEGLTKGDRVVILLCDKVEFLVASYAVMKVGGIAVPLPEAAALYTVQQVVNDCAPSLLVTSTVDLLEYTQLRNKLKCNLFLIEETGYASDYSYSVVLRGQETEELSFTIENTVPLQSEDGALILYTAGIGGQKKGVLLSHQNLIRVSLNIIEFTRIDADTCEFITVPLARSFGFSKCRCLFFAGGTVVLSNGALNPVSIVQSILRNRCNALSVIPSVFTNLFGHLESLLQRIGSQIRSIELGSSSMSADQKQHLMEIFPNAHICLHYGLTEAPRTTFLDFRKEQDKLDTVGRATPHVEIAVLNAENESLAPLCTGEIATRGDHVMLGYWNNDELTHQTMTKDGWFKTGDFGFLDDGGYLHIVGRKDEIISMDGIKFSPVEIEEHVREFFPDYEICVVGVPDPAGVIGEIPVLCYIAQNGKTITASELSRLLSNRIDKNKIPRIVYRIEPDSDPEKKLIRQELRRQFLEEFSKPMVQVK